MTSVIFVHGTGGRQADYATTFEQVEVQIKQRRLNIKVYPCLWGDSLGAKLQAGGASIPAYTDSAARPLTKAESEVVLWESLYRDPFYELRLLSVRPQQGQKSPPGQATPAQELRDRLTKTAQAPELRQTLDALLIGSVFEQACQAVLASAAFGHLAETASRPLAGDYSAITRTLVAKSRLLCKANDIYPMLLVDIDLRTQAVEAIKKSLTLGESDRAALIDWAKGKVGEAITELGKSTAVGIGNAVMNRKRGAVMSATYPAAGDILIYQAKGEKIRAYIRQQIEDERIDPPIVIIAHSLGGIACVDLLIEQDLSDQVACLVTAGSQAPFFYEIGALKTLPFGQPLPAHFPKTWLNLYDRRDFLSYVGNQPGLFPGKIQDVLVDNSQPFPESHGAYWANPRTWDAIEKVLL